MTHPQRLAQDIYATLLDAQRVAGDAPLCEALDMLAAGSGKNKFQHAANVVRGASAGRPTIDDTEALLRIASFPPERRSGAVAIVAKEVARATQQQVRSVERRLRRKLENKTDKMDVSASDAL